MPSMRHRLMPLFTLALLLLGAMPAKAVPAARAQIADTIKRDVAQVIAGINAHDPVRATSFDAPDIV